MVFCRIVSVKLLPAYNLHWGETTWSFISFSLSLHFAQVSAAPRMIKAFSVRQHNTPSELVTIRSPHYLVNRDVNIIHCERLQLLLGLKKPIKPCNCKDPQLVSLRDFLGDAICSGVTIITGENRRESTQRERAHT